jgi:hypothetical protein
MATFTEKAIINYHLSLAKKTNFCFPFKFATNKRKFAISMSVRSKQTEVAV